MLSGDPAALDELIATLEARGIFCRRVKVDVASHSPQVDPLRAELLAAIGSLAPGPTSVTFWSTVIGGPLPGESLTSGYWWRNLREPVLFADTVGRLIEQGHGTFVEVSPHPLLVDAVHDVARGIGRSCVAAASGRREEDDRRVLLESAGVLHCHGVAVSWPTLFAPDEAVVPLPPYPWQRERFWYATDSDGRRAHADRSRAPLRSAVHRDTSFIERELSVTALPFLRDHRVRGAIVVPAAAFVEMALSAAGDRPYPLALGDVRFREACMLTEPKRAQTVLRPAQPGLDGDAGDEIVQVLSQGAVGAEWTVHATARLAVAGASQRAPVSLDEVKARLCRGSGLRDHGQAMRARGLDYGPAFQGVVDLWVGEREAVARVALPAAAPDAGFCLSPSLLDACFQVLVSSITSHPGEPYLPIAAARYGCAGPLRRPAGRTPAWLPATRRTRSLATSSCSTMPARSCSR